MLRSWWRAYAELADDPGLEKLDGEMFRAWFKVMCIASRHNGVLPSIEDVAHTLRKTVIQSAAVLTKLERADLIEKVEGGTFQVTNWIRWQVRSDYSTGRVKRFRDRSRNGARNVSQQATETVGETLHNSAAGETPGETFHNDAKMSEIAEKIEEFSSLASSNSAFLQKNPFPSTPPYPNTQEVVVLSEEKKEEPKEIVEGRAAAGGEVKRSIDPTEVGPGAKPKGGKVKRSTEPGGFAEVWAAYPGRGSARNPRKTALASYAKALTLPGVTPDLILYGIKAYKEGLRKAGKIDTEFVAMAATWLNQRSWEQYAPVISTTASEERARAEAQGLAQKVWVQEGSPAWDAWDAHLRARGKPGSPRISRRDPVTQVLSDGWWFETTWPPGFKETNGRATTAEPEMPDEESKSADDGFGA